MGRLHLPHDLRVRLHALSRGIFPETYGHLRDICGISSGNWGQRQGPECPGWHRELGEARLCGL